MNTYCTVMCNANRELILVKMAQIQKIDPRANWQILVMDNSYKKIVSTGQLTIHGFKSTVFHFEAHTIFKKYRLKKKQLIKAMVPVFLRYLLKCGWTKIVYLGWEESLDEGTVDFFDLLEHHAIVLIPNSFEKQAEEPFPYEEYFKKGHYNANRMGASQAGIEAIRWWEEMCGFRVNVKKRQKKKKEELYHQQSYLNMLPSFFESIYIKLD